MKTHFIALLFAGSGLKPFSIMASEDGLTKPIMVDASNGWRQKITFDAEAILHTNDGGKHWLDVSPPALSDAVKKQTAEDRNAVSKSAELAPVDAQRAWVAITSSKERVVLLEHTADAGQHWKEKVAPSKAFGVCLSFVDDLHGFLLALGDPGLGHVDQEVFGTGDGGEHWVALTPPPAPNCYPTGISFRSRSCGWITATYHGGDEVPLYHTNDGGENWKLQKLSVPEDYRGGYANTFPPVFIGADKQHGYLPVELVRHEPKPGHKAWVTYETEDGGETWHIPASGVPSTADD